VAIKTVMKHNDMGTTFPALDCGGHYCSTIR